MAYWRGDLYRNTPVREEFKIAANRTEGEMLMRHATVAGAGEITVATVGAAADFLGAAAEDATYTTTQAATMTEGVVGVYASPFSIHELLVSGSSTAGTALVAGTHVLTVDTADTTGLVVVDADTDTNFEGGIIKGISGANVYQTRVVTAFNTGVNNTVTVPFPNDIAVGDQFIVVPWSKKIQGVNFTSDIIQADAATATATQGAAFATYKVIINEEDSTAKLQVISLDHMWNPA